jgi:DNA/RNA-binding domain of Phe-tRNA-synthetase-like protein
MIVASERWKGAYPGASVGVLAMRNVANPSSCPRLDAGKESLESRLRADFASLSRGQLRLHPMLEPYTSYYKRFDKTYHVQHQLESVVFRGKSIPRIAALVEAMFMAELKNLLLTAGHDLDKVTGGLSLDVAAGSETYTTLNGDEKTLKQGDMFIHDEEGIMSSIIYGPDRRTRITSKTTHVLFTVYAPEGVPEGRVRDHLGDLRDFVLVIAPAAPVELMQVIDAGSHQ